MVCESVKTDEDGFESTKITILLQLSLGFDLVCRHHEDGAKLVLADSTGSRRVHVDQKHIGMTYISVRKASRVSAS